LTDLIERIVCFRNTTFAGVLKEDQGTKMWLGKLLSNINQHQINSM